MILLEYIEFENGSVQFSKEEFEKLLAEHKRNLHALCMARALRAEDKAGECIAEWCMAHDDYDSENEAYWNDKMNKWQWVERKCREKAKEFEG